MATTPWRCWCSRQRGSRSAYNFLFFLAGLQSIPRSVIEAAAIDGARPMRRFWTIIFPLLSPTAFFLLVVNVVYVFFDTFGIIDAVTGGGPAGATTTLVYKVYADGRLGGDLGGSAAQSVVPDGDRDRAHRRAVQIHRAEGSDTRWSSARRRRQTCCRFWC